MPVDLDQNRLVAKDVELGTIREYEENDAYIGVSELAPWRHVESDDVIFSYVTPEVSGLAPARAEDAESEMYERDDTFGQGRASLVDWSLKDRYKASDVSRYREFMAAANASPGAFPLTITRMTEDFEAKLARDSAQRKARLDNRAEWLVTKAAWTNQIAYNDGNIMFTVPYGRPGGQTAQAPAGGLFSSTTSDPIGAIEAMNDAMYAAHGVRLDHGYASEKVLRAVINSDRFAARSGISIPSGASGGSATSGPVDPKYLIDGWGWQAAVAVVQAYTGVTLKPYDAVYRTRALGSNTTVVNRFADERDILFLPPTSIMNEISPEIGFGSMLTSPHPEGNWTSGFYEWEEETRDPWTHVRGTGVKMFPVFPFLEYSYTMRALA